MKVLKALFIATILLSSLYFFSDNKVDPDLWGHLKYGEDILKNREIPLEDEYSYTFSGSPWINHEWLSEVVLYSVLASFGGAGLIGMKVSIGLLITFLIYLTVRRNTRSLILKLLFIIVPLSVISYGFATRPQIFTYLFFTATVFLIDAFERTGNMRWLYSLPVIFLFWCNMHGGFVAGAGLLLIYCLCKTPGRGSAERPATAVKVSLITAASLAATFLSPYGAGLWEFLLRTIFVPRPYLGEWGMVSFSPEYMDYFALFLVSAAALALSKRKRDLFEIAVLAAGLMISFLSRRHIVLFAVIFSFYVPKYFDSALGDAFLGFEKKIPYLEGFSFLCLSLAFFHGTFFGGKTDFTKIEIPGDRYPVNALKFIEDNGIKGNVFSFFDWSQMCIRELPRANKVFFDGRYMTVYDKNFVDGYFDILHGRVDYNDRLSRFPRTDIMLLHPSNPLAVELSSDPAWKNVYSSFTATVFLRDDPRNRDIIRKSEKGELIYEPEKGPFYLE